MPARTPTVLAGSFRTRLSVATLAVALLSFIACSGDTGPKPPPTSSATLVMPATPPTPGAIVRVVVRGGTLTAVPAPTLGGVALSASRADDTTLVFALPAMEPGSRPLSLLLADGSLASGPLTSAAAISVASPSEFIDASLDAAVSLLDNLEADGVDPDDLESARQQLANSRTQISALNATERAQLAQFLAANAALFPQTVGSQLAIVSGDQECVSATQSPESADLEQCAERIGLVTQAEAARVTAFYSYAVLAVGSAIIPGGGVLTPIVVGLFGGLALAELRDGVAETLDRAQLPFPFAGELAEVLGDEPVTFRSGTRLAAMVTASTSQSVFLAGSPRQVRYTMRYTSPTAADAPRSPFIASMLTAYSAAATAWNKIRTLIPFFPEFPAFPSTPRQSITKAPPARTLRLGAVAPATITGTFAPTGDNAVTLSFDSQTLSEDTPFTFELIYGWNGLAEQKVTVSAVFRPVAVARVTVTPDRASLLVGDTVTFVAKGYDAQDNLLVGRSATFTADQPQTLQVNAQTGFSTALARGVTIVTAKMGAAQEQVVVDVEEGNVASIAIDQITPSVNVNGTLQLTATLRDAANNVLTSKVVTWGSATPSKATVNSGTGLVTGVAQGTSVITASSNGKSAQVTVNVVLPAFTGWQALNGVRSGGGHCAFSQSSALYCWGGNSHGQNGNSVYFGPQNATLVSVQPQFAKLYRSTWYSCGLTESGEAYCWGDNLYGELGIGTLLSSTTPAPVLGGLRFRELALTSYRSSGGRRMATCGATVEGQLYCWGSDLWNGSNVLQPQLVPGQPAGVAFTQLDISLNWGFSGATICALDSGGSAYCKGSINCVQNGQFFSCQNGMQQVIGEPSLQSISVGAGHTCGISSGGAAWCWGPNAWAYGAGPDVTNGNDYYKAFATGGGLTFTALAASNVSTCALATDGKIYCWGERHAATGQGVNDTSIMFYPTAVIGDLRFTSLQGALESTCGRTEDARIFCWGINFDGQLGSNGHSFVPREIINP